MTELARKCFASLVTDRWGYYILIDGYHEKTLPAYNDEQAKEMFNNWLKERVKAREEGR